VKVNFGAGQDEKNVPRAIPRVVHPEPNGRGLTVLLLQRFEDKLFCIHDVCLGVIGGFLFVRHQALIIKEVSSARPATRFGRCRTVWPNACPNVCPGANPVKANRINQRQFRIAKFTISQCEDLKLCEAKPSVEANPISLQAPWRDGLLYRIVTSSVKEAGALVVVSGRTLIR
jgi:hypothetical protein